MSKKICILYTCTNGLHSTEEKVSKKNMYAIARLISLTYSIGYYDNDTNKYIEEKKVSKILKPKSIHFNKEAQNFHKITLDRAIKEGIDNKEIMEEFKNE